MLCFLIATSEPPRLEALAQANDPIGNTAQEIAELVSKQHVGTYIGVPDAPLWQRPGAPLNFSFHQEAHHFPSVLLNLRSRPSPFRFLLFQADEPCQSLLRPAAACDNRHHLPPMTSAWVP